MKSMMNTLVQKYIFKVGDVKKRQKKISRFLFILQFRKFNRKWRGEISINVINYEFSFTRKN